MIELLFLFLVFQESNQDDQDGHQHASSDEVIRFLPVQPGNVLRYGNFEITVPEGSLLADEQHVSALFPLTGAEYIPDCVAIFYSSSNTWDWSIVVQYVEQAEDRRFILEPRLDADRFHELFSERHIYTSKDPGENPNLVAGPVYDDEEQSFLVAMSYLGETGEETVFLKKAWIDGPRIMVYSLRAKRAAFDSDFQLISNILGSVSLVEGGTPSLDTARDLTYLQMFGLNVDLSAQREAVAAVQEAKEEADQLFMVSVIIGMVAVVLLIAAFLLRKKRKKDSPEGAGAG
jgi:hypothetical protein